MQDCLGWRYDPSRLNGLRVLVVEDNTASAFHLVGILRDNGGCVFGPCKTVSAARNILDDRTVDVVLVDIELEDSFADDLVRDIRRRKIPFAIVTGRIWPTDADEGALAVFHKPVDGSALIDLLAQQCPA
jgi:DNA-binding NtrC family response regulator